MQTYRASSLITVAVLMGLFIGQGCSSGGPKGIPGGAMLVKEGNANLSYTATEKGTLYVRDQPADRVVYQSPVNAGQRLDTDLVAQRITLDGREVSAGKLRADRVYQIFLKPGEQREYHPTMNP
jgi:hypothetical protein